VEITNFTDGYFGEWQVWLIPSTTLADQSDIVAALQVVPSNNALSGSLKTPGPNGIDWIGTGDYFVFLTPRQPNDHTDVDRYLSKQKFSFNQNLTSIDFVNNFDVNDITQ
jgi:hypothetical protein